MFLNEFETIISIIERDSTLNLAQKKQRLLSMRCTIFCKNPMELQKCSVFKLKCPNITYY